MPASVKLLMDIVEFHSSVFGWDKTMKNFCYAFGLASCVAAKFYGPKSALAGKVAPPNFLVWIRYSKIINMLQKD
jgi:hypothetical protein